MNHLNKIVLIGFMGSGKSSLGKRLANKLNKTFFDLDTEIEKTQNRSVSEIFNAEGEGCFRKLESETLNKIFLTKTNFVLSVGGGTPCFNNNMDLINESSTSVYLKYNSGMLNSRLINSKSKRPLIKGLNDLELKEFIVKKLGEREPYYNQSKFVLEGNNIKVDDVINLIQ